MKNKNATPQPPRLDAYPSHGPSTDSRLKIAVSLMAEAKMFPIKTLVWVCHCWEKACFSLLGSWRQRQGWSFNISAAAFCPSNRTVLKAKNNILRSVTVFKRYGSVCRWGKLLSCCCVTAWSINTCFCSLLCETYKSVMACKYFFLFLF